MALKRHCFLRFTYLYVLLSIKCHCLVHCRSRVANQRRRHIQYNIAGLPRPIRNDITHTRAPQILQCEPGFLHFVYPSAFKASTTHQEIVPILEI